MHFRNSNLKHKMKRLPIPQKLVYEKFYVLHEKMLRIRNCCSNFIKNLLTEKWKENTNQTRIQIAIKQRNKAEVLTLTCIHVFFV